MSLPSVSLQDEYVALEPMSLTHSHDLFAAGQDLTIWTWTTSNYCSSLRATKTWVEICLNNALLGTQYPFVIRDKLKDKIVGSTSFLNISLEHKVIEIGYTFLNPTAQGCHVNKRCKFLLLTYAFETLGVNRVAFQTNEKNIKSRTAIMSLGATFEGIHRYARIQQDGSIRNSAFYSIVKPEWPGTKVDLRNKLISP
jgi:RimJ/RimL family protein N-acetyltransferase